MPSGGLLQYIPRKSAGMGWLRLWAFARFVPTEQAMEKYGHSDKFGLSKSYSFFFLRKKVLARNLFYPIFILSLSYLYPINILTLTFVELADIGAI